MKEEKEDNNLITFSVKQVDGVKIYAKSQIFEDFFKAVSTPSPQFIQVDRWQGLKFHPLDPEVNILIPGVTFDAIGSKLIHEGSVNLSFLRAIGLGKGISFNVGKGPVKSTYLDNFLTLANEGFRELAKTYLQPYHAEVIMTIEKRNMFPFSEEGVK